MTWLCGRCGAQCMENCKRLHYYLTAQGTFDAPPGLARQATADRLQMCMRDLAGSQGSVPVSGEESPDAGVSEELNLRPGRSRGGRAVVEVHRS